MDPFVAEIRIFGFNFAPRGWAFCNGQLLPIAQNTALFSLVGTYYGGDGRSTFGLPNLQGRAPRGTGQGPGLSSVDLGEAAGTETVTLQAAELPSHAHPLPGTTTAATEHDPQGNVFGTSGTPNFGAFAAAAPTGTMAVAPATAGGGAPHDNLQPSLALNFCIAMQGVYPPRP